MQMSDHQAAGQAVVTTEFPADAKAELMAAAARLRRGTGVLVRAADLIGGVMGRSVRLGVRSVGLPADVQDKVKGLAAAALARAFDVAVLRMQVESRRPSSNREVTRAVVGLSGAVGGFLGLGGFLPDVTVTTLAIMRSIARIAQEEGEDLSDDSTRQACLQVFALASIDGTESDIGYYSARFLMQGRPLVVLLTEVASRYGVSLSQKLALQAVPFVGAFGGAALNIAFLRHYTDMARALFVFRRLGRLHGAETVAGAGGYFAHWQHILRVIFRGLAGFNGDVAAKSIRLAG